MKPIINTGFDKLDDILCGLKAPSLIVVASRPSMGKTSFALNVVEHVATKQDIACAVFSLEESTEQIVRRLLCSCAQVKIRDFRKGALTKGDWVMLKRAAKTISKAPIFTDDSPALTVLEIEAKVRRLHEDRRLGLVVIDYLQLLRVDGRCQNRAAELSEISQALKGLATKLRLPVMVLCQLGRRLERRKDKRPGMSDLRELGSVNQDADTVLFLYRDELYHAGDESADKAEFIVGRNRDGAVGKVTLQFRGELARFDDLNDGHIENVCKRKHLK